MFAVYRISKLEARKRAALLTKVEGARAQDLSRFQAEWKERESADADAMVPQVTFRVGLVLS